MKNRLLEYAVHGVKKSNALIAFCGQDVPLRATVKKAKVTCKACLRTKALKGKVP